MYLLWRNTYSDPLPFKKIYVICLFLSLSCNLTTSSSVLILDLYQIHDLEIFTFSVACYVLNTDVPKFLILLKSSLVFSLVACAFLLFLKLFSLK